MDTQPKRNLEHEILCFREVIAVIIEQRDTARDELAVLKYKVEAIDKQATHYCLENEKLKQENKDLFNAWLYYWSNATQGAENPKTMDKYENGKYQRILDAEMESDDEYPVCNTCGGGHGRFVDGISYCDDWECVPDMESEDDEPVDLSEHYMCEICNTEPLCEDDGHYLAEDQEFGWVCISCLSNNIDLVLKPTPQGDICCNPKCNEKLSDQDDQLCHTCYHKSCEDGECYCDIMKPTPQGNDNQDDELDPDSKSYEVRTATAGGYNGSTKYLGEDIEEAKKHYFGLIGSNIDIHLDGIMVYEDDNYDCWDILKPTPQGN